MESDSNFSSLLRNLKVDDPWTSPQSWESIVAESGADESCDSGRKSQESIYDLSTISEALLVRLVLNALQGVKSALIEIDKLAVVFCSSPADRTSHRVPSLWCRSSSTNALGQMLKAISHAGLMFHLLRDFVNHYLCTTWNVIGESGDKGNGDENQKGQTSVENCTLAGEFSNENEMKMHPPYSLVNQAFSVAVGKVLEGYLSALNTLMASVKLRRRMKCTEVLKQTNCDTGVLASVVHSEFTMLEIYLHTEELRTRIGALGSICFPEVADLTSLTTEAVFKFDNFPRGADLLTYLYLQLRDADPCHHALLKFLFIRSCEPYCGFIKSWIYHANIDDPYEEFFVVYSDISPTSNGTAGLVDEFSLPSIKERDCTAVPCFLKDVCRPLLRAGQQLEVLVKLLNVCNFAVFEEHAPCGLAKLDDILPCWLGTSSISTSLLHPLTFSGNGIKFLILKRENMYRAMLDKLQSFFTKLNVRYLKMNHNVFPFGIPTLFGERRRVNSPFSLVFDGDLDFLSSSNEQGASNEAACPRDADAFSTSDESSVEMEQSESSGSSSLYGYEDEIQPGSFSELSDNQPLQFLVSSLYTCNTGKIMSRDSKIQKPLSLQHSFDKNCESTDPVVPFAHEQHDDRKLNQMPLPLKSDGAKRFRKSELFDQKYQSGRCWPLGGLLKNPFHADMKYGVLKQPHFTKCSLQKADWDIENLEGEVSYFSDVHVPFNSEFDATGKTKFINDTYGTLSSCIHPLLKPCDHSDFSINPMLTKAAWLRTVRNLRDKSSNSNNGPCFPYFDFSFVADPCKVYMESMVASNGHRSQVEVPTIVASGSHVVGTYENSDDCGRDNLPNESVLSSVCSSRERELPTGMFPSSASGGSGWQGVLDYSGENASLSNVDTRCDAEGTFETPLDVIIDKCILQEILIQYKYVSNFAIKLLEEGFDLHEHLLALQRYHFMELADWADSFILSLRTQKWSVIEPDQKIAKIQGLLDLALQRSSCESDQYKERLFVYMEGQTVVPQPTSATGVHAFDFMVLGYRVDWPLSIIITRDALKIYAEIFGNLIQVRHAVFSLTDVWHCLKAMMSSNKHGQHMGSCEKGEFSIIMKLRQQLNHFVSALQQYMHSQLSDVSWCRFQHSLKHQVKDMLDLESVHMTYLANALRICFLSAEMKPIAAIIQNILQCALDFRLCFPCCGLDVPSDGKDLVDFRYKINFSQVSAIKTRFEMHLKELYILYLKSPKHGEFSLCQFWSYLNYNDYYSIMIAKNLGCLYL